MGFLFNSPDFLKPISGTIGSLLYSLNILLPCQESYSFLIICHSVNHVTWQTLPDKPMKHKIHILAECWRTRG